MSSVKAFSWTSPISVVTRMPGEGHREGIREKPRRNGGEDLEMARRKTGAHGLDDSGGTGGMAESMG